MLTGYGGFAISETPAWVVRRSRHGARPAASSRSPACAAATSTARRGIAPAGAPTSRTCSTTSTRPPTGWSRTGYTSRDQLAIEGGSNGGLLMGAAITQRPDLARAVHCAVPLLDMIRFPQFLIAQLWTDEYGDPDVAEEFAWLHAYSPYHHVVDGDRLPGGAVHDRRRRLACRSAARPQDGGDAAPRRARARTTTRSCCARRAAAATGRASRRTCASRDDADVLTFFCWQLGVESIA